MKKKMLLVLVVLSLLMLFSVGCGGPSQPAEPSKPAEPGKPSEPSEPSKPGEQIVLKLGHVVAEGTAIDEGARNFAKLVEEKSNGEIIVEVYANASLGDNRALLEGLQLGTVEMQTPSLAPLSGFTDKTLIFDLPYLFKNRAAAEAVLDGEVGQMVLDDLEQSGFVGLAWWTQSWRHLTTGNREVRKPADMAGLKIRVMDNPLHIAHFNALGASAIPMAFSEVFTSLQQGVMDGQENPYANIKLSAFGEVQKYIIETGHIYDPIPLLMSKIAWDKLSAEHQEIILEAAKEGARWQRDYAEKQDGEIRKEYQASDKNEVILLTPEERQAFFDAVQPVYKEYEDKIGKDLIQKVIDIQKDY